MITDKEEEVLSISEELTAAKQENRKLAKKSQQQSSRGDREKELAELGVENEFLKK